MTTRFNSSKKCVSTRSVKIPQLEKGSLFPPNTSYKKLRIIPFEKAKQYSLYTIILQGILFLTAAAAAAA
jgi:hypothetical protein